jgi:hypothetical protein
MAPPDAPSYTVAWIAGVLRDFAIVLAAIVYVIDTL